jgi:hypothetical protein
VNVGGGRAKEVVMRRWIATSTGALFLVALVVSSSVDLYAADKTVNGTVAAVSPDSITINSRVEAVTLVVDSKTEVVGTGVGTKSAKMKADKKATQIVDFVKTGDQVSAKYDETSKKASQVRLVKAATVKPAK